MKKLAIFIFMLLVLVSSCKKDTESPPSGLNYQIETGAVTGISNSEAMVTGSINHVDSSNISSFGHVWSTSPHPTADLNTKTVFGPANKDTTFTSNLTKLRQGTQYYIRAYSTDSHGTFYGEETNFKTNASFFEFVVSSNYLRDDSYQKQRAWILLYSSDKNLIGIQEISNGNKYSFNENGNIKTDQYMVQLFRFDDYISTTSSDRYYMYSYLNVEPEVWYLGSEPKTSYTQIGTNVVTITDIDITSFYYYTAQNLYSYFYPSDHTLEFSQYFNPDKIWINYFNLDQAPYYKWFGTVNLNQNFSISSSDFTQMTSYKDINIPANESCYAYIWSEDDLNTAEYWESFDVCYEEVNSMQTIKVYYPDNLFTGYDTYIRIHYDNISETMEKYRGEIPDQFISLPVNASVINEDIRNFSATYTGDADYIIPYWSYSKEVKAYQYFSYYVYGAKNDVSSFSSPELPEEISSINESLLDLNNLEYSGSSFIDMNFYDDYNDFILKRFVQPGINSDIYEYYYSKTIYKETPKTTGFDFDNEEMQSVKRKPINHQ